MLTFNLKKVWFNKIKSGEKTHEYREYKYHWNTILAKEFFNPKNKKQHEASIYGFTNLMKSGYEWIPNRFVKICFMNGMIPEEKQPRMYARMIKTKLIDGLKTDLKINAPVYDIEFELIKETQYAD